MDVRIKMREFAVEEKSQEKDTHQVHSINGGERKYVNPKDLFWPTN